MRRQSQFSLPGLNYKTLSVAHGGELAKGKRKTARAIDPKQALHVVLRSSVAKGERSMLHPRHARRVQALTMRLARRSGVRVYRFANVGNHLHLLIQVRSRPAWQRFSRELAGGIAMLVGGARKGQGRKFWDGLVFTRIVKFGRDFAQVARYVIKNLFESAGVSAQARELCFVSKDGTIRPVPG
jgi:REP element-mobilizing transposase RayT